MSTSNRPELPPLGTEHVAVLNNDRFDEFVNSYDYIFVGFTHVMLPRWNHFKAIFERIARNLQKNETEHRRMELRYSVAVPASGVDDLREYRGAWREKEITQYLHRQMSELISNITKDNLESFKAQNDVVIVGYTGKGDWRLYPLFNGLARSFRDNLLFGMAWETDPEFAAAEGNFDDRKEVKWFSSDLDAMAGFIQEAARPLISEFLPKLHDDLLSVSPPRPNLDASQYAEAEMDQDLRLLSPAYPAFAIREPIKNHRYSFNDPTIPLQDALPDFLYDFLNGDRHPSVKSAPVPIQTSPVIEAVATTFDEIVLDPTKDVFIEFETKRCGPCKAIFPVLKKLVMLYKNDERWKDKVVISKMDAGANDVPGEELRMFPTFRLYPAKMDDEEERKT
ncbi:hypothetical protein BDZ45DRAFT_793415 [Acephala macrosclerotiorum]|nr:hypothetical protein BDZ45DRAFT_793415 [Acephala macrosclerotiorum]